MSYTELRENVIDIIKDFLKEGNLNVEVSTGYYSDRIRVKFLLGEEVISEHEEFLPSNNPNA